MKKKHIISNITCLILGLFLLKDTKDFTSFTLGVLTIILFSILFTIEKKENNEIYLETSNIIICILFTLNLFANNPNFGNGLIGFLSLSIIFITYIKY